MKRYTQQTIVLLGTAFWLTMTGCAHDTDGTDNPAPGTARLETRATDAQGTPLALTGYHLYGYKEDGSAASYDPAFQSGKAVATTGIATFALAATQGEGNPYTFPQGAETRTDALLLCPLKATTDTVSVPLPALFLGQTVVGNDDKQLLLQLACQTCRLNFRVTDATGLAASLAFALNGMPKGIKLADGSAIVATAILPIPFTQSGNSFIASATCLPVASPATFGYRATGKDGQVTTGSFNVGSFEKGKAYTLSLMLTDNGIHLENVSVSDWMENDLGGGNATETTS